MALLGTLANRAYQDNFAQADEVRAIRADPALAPIQPVVDVVGSGASFGGRVIYNENLFPGVAQTFPDVAARIADVSARAFVVGMDRAIIFSGVAIILVSGLSYLLIDDQVVATPSPHPAAAPDAQVAKLAAD